MALEPHASGGRAHPPSVVRVATSTPGPHHDSGPRPWVGYLTILLTAVVLGVALLTLNSALNAHAPWRLEQNVEWLRIGRTRIDVGLFLDPIGVVMLVVVSLVSLLVQVYSLGYMAGDPGINRFYAFLGLFTTSMLGLVIAPNFVQLFVFWELVGLCSYLLVGFWYFKPEAAEAAKKAFLTTRFGDLGFLVGILIVFAFTGSFAFAEVEHAVEAGTLGGTSLAIAMVLLFCGAIGKSAQVPLHVWLPDAMEGPTPVSALIHAATMVAAGVFMVARLFHLFESAPAAMAIVAWIGGITALFAATHGLVMRDIKRVLAYSTVSQLGYMMMALGLGGLAAGVFHLTTHAFFKALLFLGSGSVIHGSGDQDMYRLGGLARSMPVTRWTFLVGSLALAGVFPFAGFWSKDEVLLVALDHGQGALLAIGIITAFLTSFYIGRAYFLTFHGRPRPHWHDPDERHAITAVRRVGPVPGAPDPLAAAAYDARAYQLALADAHRGESGAHTHEPAAHGAAHESPLVMTLPLVILAVLATVAGLPGAAFGHFVSGEAHPAEMNLGLAVGTTGLALLGLGIAWRLYGRDEFHFEPLTRLGPVYTLLARKYYVDDLYDWIVGAVVLGVSRVAGWIDRHVIDGTVNGVALATGAVGSVVTRTVTGRASSYALGAFAGIALLVAALLALPVGR